MVYIHNVVPVSNDNTSAWVQHT